MIYVQYSFSYPSAMSLFHSSIPFAWICATHTLVKTLICALLSLWLSTSWSKSGHCCKNVARGNLWYIHCHDMSWHMQCSQQGVASQRWQEQVYCVWLSTHMSRFEANNNGLMKEGCTSEYNWSTVTALWTDFVLSLLMAFTTQVKREFLDSLYPSGLTFRRIVRLL